ncbi:MAG TPA: VWA domain-containing protein [Terracidiphilus sp.]|nr:VWA domain-containing protein [Terracidiphilus sp.]
MTCEGGGKVERRSWCCLALLCAAINLSAQSVAGDGSAKPQLIPRTSAEREAQYAAHRRILLNVQVTDLSGNAVTGLDAEDFTLRIDHKPGRISSFKAVQDGGATARAHAFFVIDVLNDSSRDLANTRKAIEELAGSAGLLPLPTSLIVLTENGTETLTATRRAADIVAELRRVTKNVQLRNCTDDWNNAALGKTITVTSVSELADRSQYREEAAGRTSDCLNKKYQLSLTALLDFAHRQQSVPGRAILIWIGPGWPILYGPEFVTDTRDVRQNFFANLVQVSTRMREGQVTLDAVFWPASSPVAKLNPSDFETLMSGTSTAAQASARSVAMPVLAHISGGQVYMNNKNLTRALTACLADANAYYVLGFDSEPSDMPDEFRVIQVSVDKPGVTVRTTTEYYAQP